MSAQPDTMVRRAKEARLGSSEWDSIVRVLDALPGYVMLVDDQHHVVLANQALYAATGLRPEQLLGQYCPRVIHGASGPFPGCPLEEAVASGGAVERELADEKHGRWLLSSAYPTSIVSPAGRPVFLHTTRDITELKQARDRIGRELAKRNVLDQLLEESLAGTTIDEYCGSLLRRLTSLPWLNVESKGSVFLVEGEPGVLVMKAQLRLNDALLRDCARVPFGHCLCGRAAQTGDAVHAAGLDERHEVRYPGIVEHGHYCVPVLSSAREVLGVLNLYLGAGHALNQTEVAFLQAVANVLAGTVQRKRAEARVRDYQHNLESLVAQRTSQLAESNRRNQELMEMALMHDVGTPVTVLQAWVDSLSDGTLGALNNGQQQAVAAMSRGLIALGEVRSALLAVAGLGAGSIKLDHSRVELGDLLRGAAADTVDLVQARHNELELDAQPGAVSCDARWLRRAVANLILSVVKYAGAGVRMRLAARIDDGHATFSVTDPTPAQADLRFATGMELALVKVIAEAHGGESGTRVDPQSGVEAYIIIPSGN
jgi:PAS domain S-box-containing protein